MNTSALHAQSVGFDSVLLDELRRLAAPRLTDAVRSVLALADDALFDFMQKAGGNTDQNRYIDAMRELRRRHDDIENAFAGHLRTCWEGFLARAPISADDAMGAPAAGALSLVSEDELESQIAARMLGQALQKECSAVALQVMQRLSWVGGRQPLEVETNPIGPAHIAIGLRAGFGVCDIPADIKLILFKLCERELPRPVAEIYEQLNRHLLQAGVLPHLRNLPPTNARPAQAPAPAPAPEPAPAESRESRASETYAPNERALFATLHELLRGWRQNGGTPAQAPMAAHVRPMSSNEMLSVLSLLQAEIPDGLRVAIQDPSQSVVQRVKSEVLSSVSRLGMDPGATCLNPVDEDAIDLVGMLFDVLLDERQLEGSARELIGRLVVPFIKVALLDRRMFLRKEHPARRLLNAVAEACEGNQGETPAERTLLAKAEEVVQRLVAEFNENMAIFQVLEEEFRSFMDQHHKRVELAERRTTEAQRGRERLETSRAFAAAELDKRVAGVALPPAMDVVMRRYWTHHLVVVQLREGEQSEAVSSALTCGDSLLAMAEAARSGERALAAVLPQISAGLLPVLASSGCVGEAADALVDAVSDELRAMATGKVQPILSAPEMLSDAPDPGASNDSEPTLRLVSDRAALDYSEEDAESLRSLPVGSWVEFVDAEGVSQPAKLSWVSPISSRLLFVNRRGMRVCVSSVEELAALKREKRFSVRGANSAFERAMHQVLGQLRASNQGAVAAGNGGA